MPSKSFNRPRNPRYLGPKLIIVCEGEATEVGYFEAVRIELKLSSGRVDVSHPNATDPLSIVRAAVAKKEEAKRSRAWNEKDAAWAVFDGDEHKQERPENWNDAIQLALGKGIFLGITNPSFELWYLLHYQDQRANMTRDAAKKHLKRYIPSYEKSNVLWPKPLKEFTILALDRASSLEEYNRCHQDIVGSYPNPCISVHLLLDALFGMKP